MLRIRGDLTGAQSAYEQAAAFGHEPQPGLALLWLAQGRAEAAAAAIGRLLGEAGAPVRRSQLLPPAVEVLLAIGHRDEAATAAAELESIAGSFGCPPVQARADYAAALAALESGDPAAAMPLLRRAQAVWERLGGRYEAARCRMQLGRALRALGDEESAITELAAARSSFADLGAAPAEQQAAALISPAYPGGLTAREAEVLRLVAVGKTNPQIAAELYLSDKTIARPRAWALFSCACRLSLYRITIEDAELTGPGHAGPARRVRGRIADDRCAPGGWRAIPPPCAPPASTPVEGLQLADERFLLRRIQAHPESGPLPHYQHHIAPQSAVCSGPPVGGFHVGPGPGRIRRLRRRGIRETADRADRLVGHESRGQVLSGHTGIRWEIAP